MIKNRVFYLDHARGSGRVVNEYYDDFADVLKRICELSGDYDFGARVVKHKTHYVVIGVDGVVYNIFEEEVTQEDLDRASPIVEQVPLPLIDGKCSKCGKEVPDVNIRCINCGQVVLKEDIK